MDTSLWRYAVFLLCFAGTTRGVNIKIVSMYGKYTARDDLYKQIMTDASTYVNDGNILPSGDQVNIIHNNILDDSDYDERSLFQSVFQVCNDIRNTGAAALILPSDFCANDCEDVGPIIGDAYSPVLTLDQADGSGAFKMLPKMSDMEEMFTNVISHFKWDSFIFLYEGDVAFRMGERLSAKSVEYGWRVMLVRVMPGRFEEQTEELREREVKNILMYATNEDVLVEVVDMAFETRLLSNGWHWIFGNLNPPFTQQFLEQKYRHNMAFLTRFKVNSNELRYYTSIESPIKDWQFRRRAAYDAVVATAYALRMYKDENGNLPDPIETCDAELKSTLEPYLKRVNFRGASGDVSFNQNGDRTNYTITMFSGKDKHTENVAGIFTQDIASWERANNERWPGKPGKRMYIAPFRQSSASRIRIAMVSEPPFFMEPAEEGRRHELPANYVPPETDEYQGISYDLLQEIKKYFEEEMDISFDYSISVFTRRQYGNLDLSSGEWDGAMRELIDGDVDIIMGSLTVNDAREEDIDFTIPWYVSYAKLLLIHPSYTFEYPFSIAYPMDAASWFVLLGAFLLISFLTFLMGRYDPYEWRGRSKRDQASNDEGQLFSLPEAFAFVLSTGFWQGYTRGPRSWALRTLAAFWFWFAICMTFIYLWNLNTVFKFSKTALRIQDETDLLNQDQFEFGVVDHSPAYDLFRYGKGVDREIFDRILNSELDLIENRIEDSVLRMRRQWDGRYTLLGEEKILEFASRRKPCQLYITGESLGNITFAFATASGSPLRDQLSYVINKLRNRGVIEEIVNRPYSELLNCPNTTFFKESSRNSFTVHDLQGVYYLLLIGFGASLILFVLEGLYFLLVGGGKGSSPFSSRGGAKAIPNKDIDIGGDRLGPNAGGDWL